MRNNNKIKRLKILLLGIFSVSLATFFILKALNDQIIFFYSPTQLKTKNINVEDTIRVGGLVLEESVIYAEEGMKINFVITDNMNKVKVAYEGILPDLLFNLSNFMPWNASVIFIPQSTYAHTMLAPSG